MESTSTNKLLTKHGKEVVRPKRRSVISVLRKCPNIKCLILTGLICGCTWAILWCRLAKVTIVHIDYDAFPITREREVSPCVNIRPSASPSSCDEPFNVIIPSAFVIMLYLLYLIECYYSNAWAQLRQQTIGIKGAYRYIEEAKKAVPTVWWKARCYHYMARSSAHPNQVTCERVNSRVVEGKFYHGICGVKDESPKLLGLEESAMTRIQLSIQIYHANDASSQEFEEQRNTFFQDQARRDDYLEMKEGVELGPSGWWKNAIISCRNPRPFYARKRYFWIASCLLLSWIFRFFLSLNTAHLNYQVTKLFGTNYIMTRPAASSSRIGRRRHHYHHHNQPRTPLPHSNVISVSSNINNNNNDNNTYNPVPNPYSPFILCRGDFSLEKVEDDERESFHNDNDGGRGRRGGMSRSVTLLLTKEERNGYTPLRPLGEREMIKECPPKYSQVFLQNNSSSNYLVNTSPSQNPTSTTTNATSSGSNSGMVMDDEPPTYDEALRYSRPLLPRWRRIRRCISLTLSRSSLQDRRRESSRRSRRPLLNDTDQPDGRDEEGGGEEDETRV